MRRQIDKRRTITGLLAGLMLLGNGCALLPEAGDRAKLLDMPSLEQTANADPAVEKRVREWPRAQWWRDFHNPELERLMETALSGSPALRIVRARLGQAQAVADYQAAEMLPSVGASADVHLRHFSETDFYGPTGGTTAFGAYIDPLVFRYHLDLWGKDKAALEAALGREQAQASELAVAKLILSTSIARSYFRLCSAEDEIKLAQALIADAEEMLRLARLRRDKGIDKQDPVHAAEQKLAAAHQQAASLRAQAQMLRNRLAALSGQGPDWGRAITTAESAFTGPFPLPESLSIGLLAHRPDVAAALWRVKAAAKLVKVAETEFYPDVNLVGFAGLHSLNLKDLFLSNGASVAYSIGPTVTLPIFEGGRLEASLKNEQAGYDAAVESYNEALLSAVQQVVDALAQWRKSREHDEAQERALHAAEAEAGLNEKRFRAGLNTRDSEIEADMQMIEQQLKLSELQAEHLQAAVGLIEALGGGYESKATQYE
jgi:NodT family efflux transporter outer membrane factor (OMF) lipoprotein